MKIITKFTLASIMLILVIGCGTTQKTASASKATNATSAATATQAKASPKDAIKKDFMDYTNLMLDGEYRKSLDYIPDAFFDIFPKESMVAVMEQTFNDPSLNIEMKEQKIQSIGDIKEIESKFYSKLKYSSKMFMTVLAGEGETQEDVDMTNNMMALSFEQMYGSDRYSLDEETGTFTINAQKESIAISSDGKTDWKFLGIEEQQMPILKQLLPAELLVVK